MGVLGTGFRVQAQPEALNPKPYTLEGPLRRNLLEEPCRIPQNPSEERCKESLEEA